MVIWYIFPLFGTLYKEKSGDPAPGERRRWKRDETVHFACIIACSPCHARLDKFPPPKFFFSVLFLCATTVQESVYTSPLPPQI
jgi:hypothetical protein